jgi:hypothetical protein
MMSAVSNLKDASVKRSKDAVQEARGRMPSSLLLFMVMALVLTAISLICAYVSYRNGAGRAAFRWLYFEGPGWDFYDYFDRVVLLHKPEFFTYPGMYPWYYPAPTLLVLQPLYAVGRHYGSWHNAYKLYLILTASGGIFAAGMMARALEDRRLSHAWALAFAAITFLCSWPLYYAMERGNIEGLTWLILALAMVAYRRERWYTAAILLGIVGAFKFYPAICFGLFFRPFKPKAILTGLLVMVTTTLIGLRYIEPDISVALHGVSTGMHRWLVDYAQGYGPMSATYDHSMYEILKVVTLPLHPVYETLMAEYTLEAGTIVCFVFFFRVLKLPLTNRVLFVVTAMVSLSPASFDYTLVSLYIAWAWMALTIVEAWRRGASIPAATWVMGLFAIIMAPETFLLRDGILQAGLLKGFCLLALLVVSATVSLEPVEMQHSAALPEAQAV